MDPTAYLSYRLTQQRTEDAARRAERARAAAERPEQLAPRPWIARRVRSVIAMRRARAAAAVPGAVADGCAPRTA